MTIRRITLIAIPTDDTLTLECSDCGPLGTVTEPDLHDTAILHMAEHGIHATMETP
jgi:hypothetical protein